MAAVEELVEPRAETPGEGNLPPGREGKAKTAFLDALKDARAQEAAAAKETPTPPASPLGAKASDNFKILEQSRDEWKGKYETSAAEWTKKHADLETRYKELETKMPQIDVTEIETTRNRLKEYEDIVSKFYLENDPKFIQAFQPRIDAAISDIKDLLGDKAGAIDHLLQAGPSKARDKTIKELAADLDEFDRTRLIKNYDKLTDAQRERSGELAKSKENVAIRRKQEMEKSQRSQEEQKAHTAKLEAAVMDATKALKAPEGVEEDKDAGAYRESFVRKALSADYPLAEQVKLPALAADGLHLREKVIPSLLAKLKEKDEQLARYQSSSPGVKTGQTEQRQPMKLSDGPMPHIKRPFIEKMTQLTSG